MIHIVVWAVVGFGVMLLPMLGTAWVAGKLATLVCRVLGVEDPDEALRRKLGRR